MKTDIIILAAGRSTRMGDAHKLLLPLGGQPMVRHVASMATEIMAQPIVVTGHQSGAVKTACDGLGCKFIHNPDYQDGLSTSLQAGIAALADHITHALILLGDMPLIDTAHCRALMTQATKYPDCVIRASDGTKAGNPVILPSTLFAPIMHLKGDAGAQPLIQKLGLKTLLVDIGEASLLDADTPEAYAHLCAQF